MIKTKTITTFEKSVMSAYLSLLLNMIIIVAVRNYIFFSYEDAFEAAGFGLRIGIVLLVAQPLYLSVINFIFTKKIKGLLIGFIFGFISSVILAIPAMLLLATE